jgi:formylmethanofuran dehydrogenase subunit C
MSDLVTLTLRSPLDSPLEAESIAPDRLATLSEREIAELPVWIGSRQARLGDFFDVRGERAASVRVVGDAGRVEGLGTGTAAGELVVDGDAGARTGAAMSGGLVEVHGSVGDDAGLGMSGGVLRVAGDAGDRLGGASLGASRGMTGGEIVVLGSAGRDAGARARRGLVAVCGDAGEHAARAMIAGTVVVLGRVGAGAGTGSKRGSLVAGGAVDVPPTYRFACTYHPPHVRLLLTHLRRRHKIDVDDRFVDGLYRRFTGDVSTVGRGEILAWVAG